MPPTVLLIFGFIIYFCLICAALLFCVPLLLLPDAKPWGKIIFLTALVSYPILLIVAPLVFLICLPFMYIIIWGVDYLNISAYFHFHDISGKLILMMFLFMAVAALYHWYLAFVMIRNCAMGQPIDQGIENNNIYPILFKRIKNFLAAILKPPTV